MRGEPLKWYDDNAPDNPPWLPVTVAATSITTAHAAVTPITLHEPKVIWITSTTNQSCFGSNRYISSQQPIDSCRMTYSTPNSRRFP